LFITKKQAMNINELKAEISHLSEDERNRLLSDLKLGHFSQGSYLEEVLKKQDRDITHACPRCGSMDVWSKGSYRGVKRLKCNDCGNYFSSTTGTAIYHLHKIEKWQAYVQCMEEDLPLRQSAEKVGISLGAAFTWRHKILSSLSDVESDHFAGIVEADEFYLRYSEKGKRGLLRPPHKRGNEGHMTEAENKFGVLVTTDRSGNKLARAVGKSTMNKKALADALGNKIDKSAVLCTDSYKVYHGLAKREGLNHKAVSLLGKPTQKNKVYHIQTVNNLHMAIKKHLNRFNGVSSKYLQNYRYWFIAESQKIIENEKIKLWLWLSVTIEALQVLYNIKTNAL
jgi:transposase-like protein